MRDEYPIEERDERWSGGTRVSRPWVLSRWEGQSFFNINGSVLSGRQGRILSAIGSRRKAALGQWITADPCGAVTLEICSSTVEDEWLACPRPYSKEHCAKA